MRRAILLLPLLLAGCAVDDSDDFTGTCENVQTHEKFAARVVRRGGEVEMWQYHDRNGFTQEINEAGSSDWQCDEHAKPPPPPQPPQPPKPQ